MSRFRVVVASLMAPLAFLLVPVLLFMSGFHAEPTSSLDGSVDDAPQRSTAVFLAALPAIYFFVSAYFAATAHVLAYVNRLSLKALLLVSVFVSFVFSAFFLFMQTDIWSRLVIFAIAGLFLSVCSCLGALLWWGIAMARRPDPSTSNGD